MNERDSETVTLLHWAAINNRKEIMLFLIEKGAEVDAVGGELNATPLHWATRQGHLDAAVILMNAGADPTLRDAEGCSCIHLAAQFGHTALVSILKNWWLSILQFFVYNFESQTVTSISRHVVNDCQL